MVTLTLYTTQTCRGCGAAKQAVVDVIKKYPAKELSAYTVDCDEAPDVAEQAGVRSVPTVVLQLEGNDLYETRFVGNTITKEVLTRSIQQLQGGQ